MLNAVDYIKSWCILVTVNADREQCQTTTYMSI